MKVLILTQRTIQQKAKITSDNLRENLKKLNFLVSDLSLKQYNYEFDVIREKFKAKILVYFGKKGIKTFIQGNNNSRVFKELESIINGTFHFEEAELVEPAKYIGSDESGKGDFFGPLVVCAFAYDTSLMENFLKLNIKDSKQLTDTEIIKIYEKLMENFSDRFEIVEIHPRKYNELYEKVKNLNKILVWAHSKAISNLLQRFDYKNVIIDKFVHRTKEAAEKAFVNKILSEKNLILEEKAERYMGVAAASIIARARFLKWFEKRKNELGEVFPLGASNFVTTKAQELQTQKGIEFMNDLVKLHFKNFKEINK